MGFSRRSMQVNTERWARLDFQSEYPRPRPKSPGRHRQSSLAGNYFDHDKDPRGYLPDHQVSRSHPHHSHNCIKVLQWRLRQPSHGSMMESAEQWGIAALKLGVAVHSGLLVKNVYGYHEISAYGARKSCGLSEQIESGGAGPGAW